MALSPRSPASLNISPRAQSPEKKSRLQNELTRSNSSGSSPFQTEVGTDVGAVAVASHTPTISPNKRNASRVAKNDFEIFDEDTAMLPPQRLPSSKKARLDASFSSGTDAAAVPLPGSSPVKATSYGDTLSRWDGDLVEDGTDTRSEASDDTRFSAFSAVPNADMTLFANLGNLTPARGAAHGLKRGAMPEQTPTGNVFMTPATSRRDLYQSSPSRPGSPTPRQNRKTSREGDTTNLLLDFTQQFEGGSSSHRNQSPVKSTTEPNLLSFIQSQRKPSPVKATPKTPGSRNMLNLLDFDLPPQPTPRSIPTITIRELESLKSSYLSEISSLKASLSGREAEVASLKRAVGDAERRVGEAQESLREERGAREDADAARSEWEKKGQEVQVLLAKVKEECLKEEREKQDLLQKLEESQRAREDAELRAEAAASKATIAQSEVGVEMVSSASTSTDAVIARQVAAQLDEKMENLARELHTVYKKKHESKVATLKKTYETRAEKRNGELIQTIEELQKQNEELQAAKDSTLSMELSKPSSRSESDNGADRANKAELEEQKATIAGLMDEMKSVKETQAILIDDLERERIEKGELVAAVDEMLALQTEVGASSAIEDFKRSIGPGAQTPRIGSVRSSGPGSETKPSRSAVASSGLPPRTDFGKSRMMSNIAKMGNGRSAA